MIVESESEDYKFEILKYAVNQSIDRLLPKGNKDALSVILYQSNEVVWRVATEIYTKSGHQVDFVFIKDILKVKLDTLFEHLIPESYNDWQNKMKRENIWCSSSSSICDDRYLDSVELIMAIEDEFNIEIPDEECENLLSWNVGQLVNLILQKI